MEDKQLSKFCPGCGYPIILLALQRLLENKDLLDKTVLGLDIGCALLALHSLPVNTFQTHHGRVTPVVAAFKRARPDSVCLALTGDGGAYAIGLQNLIYAAKRDEAITVLVVNNSVYAMTGGQAAPTTCAGQKTATSPQGYDQEPFLGPEFLANIVKPGAYLGRSSVDNLPNLQESLSKALQAQANGHFALLEVLSFCPTNWKVMGKALLERLNSLKKHFPIGQIS